MSIQDGMNLQRRSLQPWIRDREKTVTIQWKEGSQGGRRGHSGTMRYPEEMTRDSEETVRDPDEILRVPEETLTGEGSALSLPILERESQQVDGMILPLNQGKEAELKPLGNSRSIPRGIKTAVGRSMTVHTLRTRDHPALNLQFASTPHPEEISQKWSEDNSQGIRNSGLIEIGQDQEVVDQGLGIRGHWIRDPEIGPGIGRLGTGAGHGQGIGQEIVLGKEPQEAGASPGTGDPDQGIIGQGTDPRTDPDQGIGGDSGQDIDQGMGVQG